MKRLLLFCFLIVVCGLVGQKESESQREGLTAFDLAKTYHHEAMVKLLAAKTAAR